MVRQVYWLLYCPSRDLGFKERAELDCITQQALDVVKTTAEATTFSPTLSITGTPKEPGKHKSLPRQRHGFLPVCTCAQSRASALDLNPFSQHPSSSSTPLGFWHIQNHKIRGSQAHRKERLQSETARSVNTRDNQMVRGKHKNISNRNQSYLATSESSYPTTASPRYPKMSEKQYSDLKSHLMNDKGL